MAWKVAIVGQTSLRQKLKTLQYLRDLNAPAVAMDLFNAKIKRLWEKVCKCIIFREEADKYPKDNITQLIELGWKRENILVEGEEFPINEFPTL